MAPTRSIRAGAYSDIVMAILFEILSFLPYDRRAMPDSVELRFQ